MLTPVTVDPAHPFPHVLNKALCLAFTLKRKRRGSQSHLGVVTVPSALPRLVLLPSPEGKVEYVFLHDVVRAFAERLYRASQAGVQIELIVRGACALRPGVRGLSSRIRVRSVIGRFLEHSRIFVFGNGGKTEVFLGSADWMQRNIHERVEVIFHLKDPALCAQLFTEVIAPYLADTQKTRMLLSNGDYVRLHEARQLAHVRNGHQFNVQEFLIDFIEGRQGLDAVPPMPAFIKHRSPATQERDSA